MENKLKRNWEEFCNSSIKNALSKLSKNNHKYRTLMTELGNIENLVIPILHDQNILLTDKQVNNIKKYLLLSLKKNEFEKIAIYSQGVCDSFSILEKYK